VGKGRGFPGSALGHLEHRSNSDSISSGYMERARRPSMQTTEVASVTIINNQNTNIFMPVETAAMVLLLQTVECFREISHG